MNYTISDREKNNVLTTEYGADAEWLPGWISMLRNATDLKVVENRDGFIAYKGDVIKYVCYSC